MLEYVYTKCLMRCSLATDLRMPVAPAIVAGMTSYGFSEKDMAEAVQAMVSTPFTASSKAPSRAVSSAIAVSYSGECFVDDVGRRVSSCAGDKEGPLGEGKVFRISCSHSEPTAVRIDCIYKGFGKMRSMEYQKSATRLLLQLLFCLNTFQRRVEVGIIRRFCGARTSI